VILARRSLCPPAGGVTQGPPQEKLPVVDGATGAAVVGAIVVSGVTQGPPQVKLPELAGSGKRVSCQDTRLHVLLAAQVKLSGTFAGEETSLSSLTPCFLMLFLVLTTKAEAFLLALAPLRVPAASRCSLVALREEGAPAGRRGRAQRETHVRGEQRAQATP